MKHVKVKSQIAETTRGPIEYTLVGQGPVVLVCHGTSSDCFSAESSEALREAGFAVLSPSRPGYGRTPLTVGSSAVQAAEALVALLDCLAIETCAVKAISGGGPTGVTLAANYPERVHHLALIAALTKTEGRTEEPSYQSQITFYGPLHGMMWTMLGILSHLSPNAIAKQTIAIFSTHNVEETFTRLSPEDIKAICHFYQHHSSRAGAINDLTHTVGKELLGRVQMPTLVIHSREDKSVPFQHAEWSLAHIPNVELCESGITGHFYWVGPDYPRISQKLVSFLKGP